MQFEFELQAMRGEPCPKGLDVVETNVYMALRNLYALYRRGEITRALAREEKNTIMFNMVRDKSKLDFLNRQSEALRKKIGKASKEYVNNPSVETADELYRAFYNLPKNWRQMG